MRTLAYLLSASLILAPAASANDLPDLGESARSEFTLAQETRIGSMIMQDIRQSPRYVDDAELSDYVNQLGYRLAGASQDSSSRQFNFFIINDPTLNAFALPGGNIGIHTGLLLAAQHESELAGVLAHEIAHITQSHLARMLEQQKQMQLPTLAALALAILAARSNPQVAQAAISLSQATAIQSQLDFSRDNEREADRIGMQTLNKARFDPRGMVDFFQRLQTTNRLMEHNAPEYLRTHPLTTQRIADMQDRVEQLPYRQHLDTLDFRLAKARARVLSTPASEASDFFNRQLKQDGQRDQASALYGLSLLALNNRQPQQASEYYARIPNPASDPMLLRLGAEVALAGNKIDAGLELYRQGIKRYPGSRALAIGYASALLEQQRNKDAIALLQKQLREHSTDDRMYELLARAYSRQGQQLEQHQAQAEAYAIQGNLTGAVEQIQLALQYGSNASFYQLSSLEARLRELKRQDLEQRNRSQN